MNFDSYLVKDINLSTTLPLTDKIPKIKSLKGFTLAEVLITLTIIGVIAAMTVPTLLANHQKQTFVVGLKKAYSNLANAMRMLPIEMGCSAGDIDCTGIKDSSNTENIDGMDFKGSAEKKSFYLATKLLKVTKYDLNTETDFCKKWNAAVMHTNDSCAYTADGMVFMSYGLGYFFVDVNGAKGPNKMARDQFIFFTMFESYNSGIPILPYGGKYATHDWQSNCKPQYINSKIDWIRAATCTARVLEEGSMNY